MSERKLAKNTIFYSAALASQKVLSFLFFIILARSLGVVGQGRFTFALSFVSLFSIFLDLGLSQVLIRETARDKDRAEKYLSDIIGFKLLAALILYGLVFAAINLLGYPSATKELVYVSGLIMIIDSLTLSVYAVIRGRQNLAYESLGTIGNQLIVLILGGGLLLLHANPVLVMAAYLIASLGNLLWSIVALKRTANIRLKALFRPLEMKTLVIWSLPFAAAGIFSRIFSSIDVVMLSKMAGDHAVGIYSAAFKVSFALQFVALAFSASLYPAFSTYWAHSRENLGQLFTKSMFWLMFLAGPIVFGAIAVADPAIPMMFGQAYAPSVMPLQILLASMLFVFLCFPIGALLNACDKQGRHTVNLAAAAISSIVLNLILIPLWSYNGSAVANLISYLLLFGMGLAVANKIITYDKKYLLWSSVKILLACAIMFAAAWFVKREVNFVAAIIAGGIVYLVLGYILNLYRLGSLKDLTKQFRRGKSTKGLPEESVE